MSKEKEAEQEFIEIYSPIDAIESTHYGRMRTIEYGDEERYSLEQLRAEAQHWIEQSSIPERSERSTMACLDIARLAIFECAYRQMRVGIFIATQRGEMPDMEQALSDLL